MGEIWREWKWIMRDMAIWGVEMGGEDDNSNGMIVSQYRYKPHQGLQRQR